MNLNDFERKVDWLTELATSAYSQVYQNRESYVDREDDFEETAKSDSDFSLATVNEDDFEVTAKSDSDFIMIAVRKSFSIDINRFISLTLMISETSATVPVVKFLRLTDDETIKEESLRDILAIIKLILEAYNDNKLYILISSEKDNYIETDFTYYPNKKLLEASVGTVTSRGQFFRSECYLLATNALIEFAKLDPDPVAQRVITVFKILTPYIGPDLSQITSSYLYG